MKNVSFRIGIVDKISAGLKNIKGGFEKVAKAATTLQSHIDNIDYINLSAAFDVLDRMSGHIESATEASMSFGQAMADLSSITGITGAELEELSAQSRKFGKESGLGADTAARAYSLLASQIDVAEIGIEGLNILQQKSITLAQASGMSLDGAADALAGTVNQFGLGADAADRVINVLAAGSKYGAAEIEHLTQSFKVVGSAASAMGLNVEETAGALEILSLANLKGSEAGTALRNIILKLNTELGVDLGEFSLGSALDALKPKLSDATYLAKVFGVENIAAAQFLIQNATAVDEMTTKLTGTAVAEEQAAIRTQTSAQRMAELRAQVEDLKISLADMGGSMTPYIALTAEHAEILGMMGTAATKAIATTRALNAAVRASTGATIAQNIAIKAKLVASKAVTAATATWSAVQKGLNLILTANPIGLVVAAIGALVASVIAAYNNCETFREICDALWAQIKKLAQLVWGHLVEAFNTVTGAIKTAWQWLKEFFGWDDEGPAEEVNKTTGAIEAQTSAIEGNIRAKKKLSGLTLSADGAQGGAPKGSMSALDKEMQDIKARIEVTVDDTQLRLLGEKLAELEGKKNKLQFIVDTAGEAPTARVRDMLGGVQMPTMKFDASPLDKGAKIASKRFKEMEKAQGRFNQTQQDSAGLVGSLGQSFGVMGDAIGGAAGAMLQWASQTIAAIAQVLPQILTLITAKQAEGMAGATASGSMLPFPYNLVAIAAGVTAVIAQFARIPKFADGGIAYGPTLGLFGEYAGASHNPEVVAPLDRLRTLIGGTTEGGGKVEFSIKGRRLVGVMERENHSRGRR